MLFEDQCIKISKYFKILYINIVMYGGVRVGKITVSRSDDWIY
jgi:hypothetical protein